MNTNSLNSNSLNALAPLLYTPVTSNFTGQCSVSGYKWLTSTLFDTQQRFTVRPYVQCGIIDETNLFNSQITNNGQQMGLATWAGDACIAPDGSILAIGKNTNGDLAFAVITDGTQLSQWNNVIDTGGTIIAANGDWMDHNPNFASTEFHTNASIAVSDWINGTYVIDVFFWVQTGGYFQISGKRSTDGGSTWNTFVGTIFSPSIPDNTRLPFCLAAGKPVYIPSTGDVSSTMFYSNEISPPSPTSFSPSLIFMAYSALGTYTDVVRQQITEQYADSEDWVIHSLDVEYINGTYYIVFSGYHLNLEATNWQLFSGYTASTTQNTFFGNFGLYLMTVQQPTEVNASVAPNAIWSEPREILAFNSSFNTNLNQVLYPSLSYDGTYLWVVFRGDFTQSVSETLAVTTLTNYYLSKSKDFINFDYPTQITDSSGNTIPSPGILSPTNGLCKYVFVGNQNGYYYVWGDGALWQYVQNNVIADVSNDVISFQIQDQTGGASSVNLTIANSNGKWAGPSPTGTNYQAIWKNGKANKNSKVYLRLGYYTPNGGETVPRNVFYIDDITQNFSATQNDLVITGRDFNKLLATTQTRFSYSFQGPDMYYDGFNNMTIANWNTIKGTWAQVPDSVGSINFNSFAPFTTYVVDNLTPSSSNYALSGPTLAILSGFSINKPVVTIAVDVYLPASTAAGDPTVNIYPFYISSNNYTQVEIKATGSVTTLSVFQINPYQLNRVPVGTPISGAISAGYYTIYMTMYNYAECLDILVGQTQNNIVSFIYPLSGLTKSFIMAQPPYQFSNGQLGSVAIGTDGDWGVPSSSSTPLTKFANFRFIQYSGSQTIEELTKRLAIKAHIFDYVPENDFVQDLYDATQWGTISGSFSLLNREINLSAQSGILQNNLQYTDGQIEFDAKVSPGSGTSYGFDFVLRSVVDSDLTNCYKVRIMKSVINSIDVVKVSLVESTTSPITYVDYPLFSSIMPDDIFLDSYAGTNNLNVDLTQWNHFQIGFNKGWIYVFINKNMVFAWYDNNYTKNFTSGYWGFSTINNGSSYDNAFSNDEVVYVKNIYFPTFWQQTETFALNPGDDLISAITSNLQDVFGWMFSDLGGRFKMVILKSSDVVSYYYGNGAINYLLYSTSNDNSDKEYYNEVLVVGDGVSYLATSGSNIGLNNIVRSEVIVDYKIITLAAAQQRAQQELSNISKYGVQPAPTTNINVGSEAFDVVNIVDTGAANATNLNGNYRVYTQNLQGDEKSNYSVQLGTGQLSQ
jgi:hypothetical protein